MAFVNEKLTDEQREKIKKLNILRPDSGAVIVPIYQTIDRERDAVLFRFGQGDRDFPHEQGFVFLWNTDVIFLEMHWDILDSTVWSWRIPKEDEYYLGYFKYPFSKRNGFLPLLKEALMVYKTDGSTYTDNIEAIVRVVIDSEAE